MTLVEYKKLIEQTPDTESETARVWQIRKNETIRINLVEMSGELKLHLHPDADHSLIVLEGRVKVQIGDEFREITNGDFISIPAGVPHKYWALGRPAMLVSMDAPYYDPEKTVVME